MRNRREIGDSLSISQRRDWAIQPFDRKVGGVFQQHPGRLSDLGRFYCGGRKSAHCSDPFHYPSVLQDASKDGGNGLDSSPASIRFPKSDRLLARASPIRHLLLLLCLRGSGQIAPLYPAKILARNRMAENTVDLLSTGIRRRARYRRPTGHPAFQVGSQVGAPWHSFFNHAISSRS